MSCDGKSLTNGLAALLNETLSTSSFLETKSIYDYLYEAALEFARRTRVLTTTQTITTVADQAAYDLNPDFLCFYLRDSSNRYVAKLDDGSNDYWLPFRDYEAVTYANNEDSVTLPTHFSLIDNATVDSNITGTATANGAATGNECTLTDSAGDFTNVEVGDDIHNTTDGSDGVVLAVTSTTALQVALFGGTGNDITSADAYVIVPQGRKSIVLDPPPSTSGYTLTLRYVQKPDPVYSYYRKYRFDSQYAHALIKYAAWLFKYKDSSPNFGDAFYKYWDQACRMAAKIEHKSFDKPRMRVNMIKSSYGTRSER
jgi:hypothetical protein